MFLAQKGHVPMVGQEQAVPAGSGAVPPGGGSAWPPPRAGGRDPQLSNSSSAWEA